MARTSASRFGFIGYERIDPQWVDEFNNQPEVVCAGMRDVYVPRLLQGPAKCGPGAKGHGDFRRMLDDNVFQAIVVSNPEH